jgi:hypothetical protein
MTPIRNYLAFSPPEKLLLRCGVARPDDIDLDAIAAFLGVDVLYRPLDRCEARLVRRGNRGVVSINTNTANVGRRRFSLAHELAHWECDTARASFSCGASDVGPTSGEGRRVEADANAFASQLVLPDYLLRGRLPEKPITFNQIAAIGEDFRVSTSAAAWKLARMSAGSVLLAAYRNGRRVGKFLRSRAAPLDLEPAFELHHDTEAFAMTFEERRGLGTPRREPAERWLQGSRVRGLQVTAQPLGFASSEVLVLLSL